MSYNFTQEEIDKLHAQYQQLVDKNQNLPIEQFAEKVNSLPVRHDKKEFFRKRLCDGLLNIYCAGWSYYSNRLSSNDKFLRQLICDTVEKLPQDYYWYWSVCHFFNGDYKSCERCLDKRFQTFADVMKARSIDENFFAQDYLAIFKSAYPGFWKKDGGALQKSWLHGN